MDAQTRHERYHALSGDVVVEGFGKRRRYSSSKSKGVTAVSNKH